jgi:hypothetical protein
MLSNFKNDPALTGIDHKSEPLPHAARRDDHEMFFYCLLAAIHHNFKTLLLASSIFHRAEAA